MCVCVLATSRKTSYRIFMKAISDKEVPIKSWKSSRPSASYPLWLSLVINSLPHRHQHHHHHRYCIINVPVMLLKQLADRIRVSRVQRVYVRHALPHGRLYCGCRPTILHVSAWAPAIRFYRAGEVSTGDHRWKEAQARHRRRESLEHQGRS